MKTEVRIFSRFFVTWLTIFCYMTHNNEIKCAILKSSRNYFVSLFKTLKLFISNFTFYFTKNIFVKNKTIWCLKQFSKVRDKKSVLSLSSYRNQNYKKSCINKLIQNKIKKTHFLPSIKKNRGLRKKIKSLNLSCKTPQKMFSSWNRHSNMTVPFWKDLYKYPPAHCTPKM